MKIHGVTVVTTLVLNARHHLSWLATTRCTFQKPPANQTAWAALFSFFHTSSLLLTFKFPLCILSLN